MSQKPLTTNRLALQNLIRNPFRSICLILVVFVLAFTLFGASILSLSLRNGLSSLKNRLGADLAIVPLEHESDYEGIILSGEPEKFYFDRSIEAQIANVEGVKSVSSQFYISTLAAACCSVPVQVIGFDPDTDFVINPWITKVYQKEIKDGELIVGSDIVLDETKSLRFFKHTFPVVAQLDKTSTGMDYSVYANMNTIQTFVTGAKEFGLNLSVDVFDADIKHSISAVLVKTEEGYDVDTVTTNIRREISGIGVVKSKNVFTQTASSMDLLLTFVYTVIVILWMIAVLILSFLFSLITNTRKREFALLRFLGATKGKLSHIVLAEAFLVSISGSIAGTMFAAFVVFPFSTYIGETLHLPYLLPDIVSILRILLLNIALTFAVGPLTAVCFAIKLSRVDTYISIREGE